MGADAGIIEWNVGQKLPDGSVEKWTYNQFGQVATSTDFDGNKSVYQYFSGYGTNQSAGALQQVSYYAPGASSPTSTVSYSYTALGQQRQVNDSSGTITTYTYDPSGNETSVETDITTASIANDEVIHYVYDQVTNLLVETWTGGPSVTTDSNAITETKYGYTAQGQLQTVAVVRQNGSPVTGSPTTMYSYDADGNVTKIAYPNGTETDYDYSQMWNTSGGIETVTNKRGSTVLSSFVYTFNAQREKISSQEYMLNVGETSSTNTTITWQYDADGHLTDETLNDGVAADGYHDRYIYDPAGNRIEEDITPTTSGASTTENYYQYNADGQLTTETDSSATSIVNHYDANGSLIETDSTDVASSVTTTTTYGYDERGRMTSMTKGGVTSYAYNTNGDRIGEYNTSSSSTYVVDDNNPSGYSQVLETWTGGSMPAVTYEIGSAILSQTVSGSGSGAGTQYIMPDGHGSTRQLTAYTTSSGSNGTVVAREDYDGFGNSITIVAVPANIASTVILYVGQMWDPGPQTYDDRAREYDPRIGRFNSFDGINIAPDDIVNANKYLYAGANPVMYADPSGHASVVEVLGVIGIGLTILDLGFHVSSAISHFAHGQTNAGNQDMVWAMIDLLTFGIPAGPAARPLMEAAESAMSLSRAGVPAAAIWGYLTTFFSVASNTGGSSGGSPSSGGSGGTSSEPGIWKPKNEGMPPESAQYQTQITGRSGQVYEVNDYDFDGWDGKSLLDAKDNYSWALDSNGRWLSWFGGGKGEQYWVEMAAEQRHAAGSVPIVWHFAQQDAADAVRPLVNQYNIDVVCTPRAF